MVYKFSTPLSQFKKAVLLTEILIKIQMGVKGHYRLAAICALITVWKLLPICI